MPQRGSEGEAVKFWVLGGTFKFKSLKKYSK